jgi:hypothetical protein
MPAPCISTVLNTAVNNDCVDQLIGFEKDAVLVPLSVVDKADITFESDTVIMTELTLVGAGKGQKITVVGDLPYSETNISGTQGAFIQLFESTFAFPILENSPAAAKQVMQLGNDHYLAILTLKGYTAAKKNKYMVVGLNRGLHFATGNLANTSQDEAGWRIELKEMEGVVPVHFLWKTDEATTDSLVAGLLPA